MKEFGFIRVAAAVPEVTVANINENTKRIIEMIAEADSKNAAIVAFPEMCLTGYTCADLFHQKILLCESQKALGDIVEATKDMKITSIIGLPVKHEDQIFNTAAVISNGKLLGLSVKTYIPNYSEFYEKRWFSPAKNIIENEIRYLDSMVPFGNDLIYKNTAYEDMIFSIEFCEDLWVPIPPSSFHSMAGALLIFNLSASNELVGKSDYRKKLVASHSGSTISGYVYTSASIGESSTDTVYGGHALIAEYGQLLSESARFDSGSSITYNEIDLGRLKHHRMVSGTFTESEDKKKIRRIEYSCDVICEKQINRRYSKHPFVPGNKSTLDKRCSEIFNIQTSALYKRIKYIGNKKVIIGVSGGLDSTLALLVTEKTFEKLGLPKENIIAVTMPGFGTSDGTYKNSLDLITVVGAQKRMISIKKACLNHFKDILHDENVHNIVYENVQARERMMLLMNIANEEGGIVIGTGDLSEIALGWSTYNGDHMSMYAVNSGVPKTLVKFLIEWVAENEVDSSTKKLLKRIIDTPISPELLPPDNDGKISQRTEDVIGPYELHDFFLYHAMRSGSEPKKIFYLAKASFENDYSDHDIKKWLKVFYIRFFQNQYKRSCVPDGPKVGTIALSPRADWRMPSDADVTVWIEAISKL